MKKIEILGREISKNCRPYIIAELSANHNGSIDKALELVDLAADSGADAIKLQTYTADTMTIDCNKEDFQIKGGLWDGYSLYKLYDEAHTPWEWHKTIFDRAKEKGIHCFSSPFDESAVDFLEELGVPAYKIASFEMIDLPLVEKIAATGKPVIMSTGMANLGEIRETVATIKQYHNHIIVLHCVSSYPAPHADQNLRTIEALEKELGVLVGLSDHTISNSSAVTSVAFGAVLIEKHFIKSRLDKGPDSEFSLEPHELKDLVVNTTEAWESMGSVNFELKKSESANKRFRRSIYFVKDLKKGEEITPDAIKRIRPGFGLEPKYFKDVLGKKVLSSVERGQPTSWDVIG